MPSSFAARCSLLAMLLLLAMALSAHAADPFPLQDGDTWVMGGDSITAQHLHSNYFEAFCYARYPQLKFRFRNAGVGGDTIPKLIARFDWDVAAWKPTVVSVELGMNDQGGFSVEQYIANMTTLVERIRSSGARPVMLTSSPVNEGGMNPASSRNAKLSQYAKALEAFAKKQDIPFADQFHELVDLWGRNKPRENLSNLINSVTVAAKDDKLIGVEHLRQFVAAQASDPEPKISLMGDPVHPGPTGQLTMAAALLKELGASTLVSTAEIAAGGEVVAAKGCTITETSANGGKLSFTRLDECLPFPIPDDARPVLPLYPPILELSQYTLKVSGLPREQYELRVNGELLGKRTAKELAAGVNLTSFSAGPIAVQGKAILAAVALKEGLVGQWRSQSRMAAAPDAAANIKELLAATTKSVEAADVKIREAAQPKPLKFEIAPVK